jgi:YD repeat-containing protein
LLGPNGGQANTTYDSYGRPSQSTTPDGAVTTYTYTYSPFASTQTASLDGRWQTTTLDGFGRTIQVQKGNGSTVVSTVQTLYAPCACSPLGKMSAVSMPYAPGATPVWTTYTHDGSGRTLTVTAPDGASTTTYSYQGNSTTVTDPAGHWKTTTVDAYGNTVQVTEPNPAGGTFTTNYTYTPANQLTQVSMTRGNVTAPSYITVPTW